MWKHKQGISSHFTWGCDFRAWRAHWSRAAKCAAARITERGGWWPAGARKCAERGSCRRFEAISEGEAALVQQSPNARDRNSVVRLPARLAAVQGLRDMGCVQRRVGSRLDAKLFHLELVRLD